MANWTDEEKTTLPKQYKCELIYAAATNEQIHDPKLPRDAYIVQYRVNKKLYTDVCRAGRRVDIFDLYYDKFGKDSVRLIDFGHGKISSNLWKGTNPKEKKKK
jgi:hypothetical protein